LEQSVCRNEKGEKVRENNATYFDKYGAKKMDIKTSILPKEIFACKSF